MDNYFKNTYMTKRIIVALLRCALLALSCVAFVSCSSVLSLIADYDKCMYPGCSARAKKGEVHCSMHDLKPVDKNLNKALDKARKPYMR